jgi:polyhydroxyalkanoate synthesis repressor PhaR
MKVTIALCRSTKVSTDLTPEDPNRVQLRRYSNRRYYDAARSQHLTLEDIFRLICDGQQVQVNDSKTGEDITVRVLAQLILAQAPQKLAALPAELFHQIIRSNESLLREFVDKYFYRALSAFIDSQREFDRYLRQALGLPTAVQPRQAVSFAQGFPFLTPNWATLMMEPFTRAMLSGSGAGPSVQQILAQNDDGSDLRKVVEELKLEVEALRKELKTR